MADGIRLGMDDRLKIMLSPATAKAISAVAVFLATLAVAPACVQQANTPLVDEISVDSLAALISAAEQGDASAQFYLAVMYATGEGVPEDDAEADRWYRAAAEQGLAPAQYYLGLMYDIGEGGVPEDDAEAVRWYRAAAEQGNALAQSNLGVMYANGEGVPEDYVLAYAWMNLAGAQGVDRAQEAKDLLSSCMTSEQVARAQELSVELLRTIKPTLTQ